LIRQKEELDTLSKAIEERQSELRSLKIDPSWEYLRSIENDSTQEDAQEIEGRRETFISEAVPEQDMDVQGDDDPFEAAESWNREFWIKRILVYHDLASQVKEDVIKNHIVDYMERLLVLAIIRRPTLASFLDPDISDVALFLHQPSITLHELKQLAFDFMSMPPRTVFNAIIDAFRNTDEPSTLTLGRRLFSSPYHGEIPLEAWDLYADLTACTHCVLKTCPSLGEWTRIQRIGAVSQRYCEWRWPSIQPNTTSTRSIQDIFFCLVGIFCAERWPTSVQEVKYDPDLNIWVERDLPTGLYMKVDSIK
jgi:hypothetical protein